MERLTKLNSNLEYIVEDDTTIKSVLERLAIYENMYDGLKIEQEELTKEMEKLRTEGKKTTARFKELMGKKLVNTSLMSVLKIKGIKY